MTKQPQTKQIDIRAAELWDWDTSKRADRIKKIDFFFLQGNLLYLSLNQQHLHLFSYDTDSQSLCDTPRYSRSSVKPRGERNHWIGRGSDSEHIEKQLRVCCWSIYNRWSKEKHSIPTPKENKKTKETFTSWKFDTFQGEAADVGVYSTAKDGDPFLNHVTDDHISHVAPDVTEHHKRLQ